MRDGHYAWWSVLYEAVSGAALCLPSNLADWLAQFLIFAYHRVLLLQWQYNLASNLTGPFPLPQASELSDKEIGQGYSSHRWWVIRCSRKQGWLTKAPGWRRPLVVHKKTVCGWASWPWRWVKARFSTHDTTLTALYEVLPHASCPSLVSITGLHRVTLHWVKI